MLSVFPGIVVGAHPAAITAADAEEWRQRASESVRERQSGVRERQRASESVRERQRASESVRVASESVRERQRAPESVRERLHGAAV
ncbi:hypothetical protein EYF80_045406 [Liparis tanakae]|uniref:Uncharacterized protein n=1 Tax=Liparis tanakae TaxID=230148 RepID=A0A4Z2FUF2_9TELE|nr:hypothetical protein EYF80_045406 [Liparis tanakae]